MRIISSLVLSLLFAGISFAGWTTPVAISELNTAYVENASYISPDGLTIYLNRGSTPEHYVFQLYKATRTDTSSPFTVTRVTELSSSLHTTYAWQSLDGLRLYYNSDWSLKMSTRASVNDAWSTGTYISSINAIGSVEDIKLTSDELTAVFDSTNGQGGYDLYVASRTDKNSAFTSIRRLTELNTAYNDNGASLSADGLTLYFQSDRSGQMYCYQSTRNSLSDSFGTPELLPFAAGFGIPKISTDGKTLLLAYDRDIYVSYYIPEPATMLLLGFGAMLIRKK